MSQSVSFDRKLHWCKQAAEVVSHFYAKHIIHCVINLRNLFLDEKLDLLQENVGLSSSFVLIGLFMIFLLWELQSVAFSYLELCRTMYNAYHV
jgi:hypothetical protein